jgi:cytochrome c oxidase subunit 2
LKEALAMTDLLQRHPALPSRRTRGGRAIFRLARAGAAARRRIVPALVSVAGSLLLGGCGGNRDGLDAASTEAKQISSLWWTYFWVCAVVFGLVMLSVLGVIARARRQRALLPNAAPAVRHSKDPADSGSFIIVTVCTVATALILFALLIVDFRTGHAMTPITSGDVLTVKITGKQWWWQIEYEDAVASNMVITGNELHLPVGRPVKLLLESTDVIHSFWIPNLQGKKDLVPGHPTALWLHPTEIGRYHGQCAEFCGLQHAHMQLLAVVESPEDFAKWQDAQRKPAPEPQTDAQKRGRDVFLTTSCVMCHTIQGTPANSHVGPPLTHIASQEYLAANSFPNRRGYLAGWIVDPQSMKPGAHMPQNLLSPDDLNALLDYLETLK